MKLIVLTKKWGRNFTGATLATQYYIKQWLNHFENIHVFSIYLGDSNLNSLVNVHKCQNEYDIKKQIKTFVSDNPDEYVGYSDDHLGLIFHSVKIKYLHTYHGNWPDAKWTNPEYFAKSFYFIPLYKKTIKHASFVVNVSEYMQRYTEKYNDKSKVIHNGIDVKKIEIGQPKQNAFLMVGNVDRRKYGLAIPLFKEIKNRNLDIKIDIYGRIDDKSVAKEIETYDFVNLCGICKEIPYSSYIGLINTSRIENLSISVCEALINKIPVYCFRVGGLPEVVSDNCGYVIDQFDISGMVDAIEKYDNEKLVPMLRLDEFDWGNSSIKYIEQFQMISK